MKESLIEKLEAVKTFLHGRCGETPKLAFVLGSGLGALVSDLEVDQEIPYGEIPHFKQSSVVGHEGRLVVGKYDGVPVVCMQGRLHYYEGHPLSEVVFPARALAWAGAEAFLLTNASGGLHLDMAPLDFLLIRDHINLMGSNPLFGPNFEELGPRFPDLTHLYDQKLSQVLKDSANALEMPLREGVYVGTHGPSYETPAEIVMYRNIGGDVVGMSTVPEAIALRHMGRRVVGLSCITNMAAGVTNQVLDHEDVLSNAHKIYEGFSRLMKQAIQGLAKEVG